MTVEVAEEDGIHRAGIPFEDASLPCCTPGHPDPGEAALHALTLTQAIRRKSPGSGNRKETP
jgi:hypothetical protein